MRSLDKGEVGWVFPPRGGGIDYAADPASSHFGDAPMPKLVREVVQNSLDAKHSGFSAPVVVEFSEVSAPVSLIGGNSLRNHIEACLERAKSQGWDRVASAYERAIETISHKTIRCLKATDSGTVGLDEVRWNALVSQEGVVSKLGNAPSGAYGIGKNAVLNVSDIQTVFYSTRYVAGRKGRVEWMQGKATLMGHDDPGSAEPLQHIGFYVRADGSPVEGRKIPKFFRLRETGTGVFVMGFNPRSAAWTDEVTHAVIDSYFCAIADQKLVVRIEGLEERTSVEINHETIDSLFLERSKPGQASYYYRVARDTPPIETKRLGELGPLSVRVAFESDAPRRIALVNRNGMFISDSKDQRINPFSRRADGQWPDFAAVVMPATDRGDNWMRSMENPSHDSLSSGHLPTEAERKEADAIFFRARQAISEVIEELADLKAYGDESNIDELTDVLADVGEGQDIALTATELPPPRDSGLGDVEEDPADDGAEDADSPDWDESGDSEDDDSGDEDDQDVDDAGDDSDDTADDEDKEEEIDNRRPAVRLGRPRVIPVSPTEAVVSVEIPEGGRQELRLSLARMGADRDARLREILSVLEAQPLGGIDGDVKVESGRMTLKSDGGGRLSLKVLVDEDIERAALRLTAS